MYVVVASLVDFGLIYARLVVTRALGVTIRTDKKGRLQQILLSLAKDQQMETLFLIFYLSFFFFTLHINYSSPSLFSCFPPHLPSTLLPIHS